MSTILWLRRDLRLHDSPALQAALTSGEAVVPVFCLDPRLLSGKHRCDRRTAFLFDCLRDLGQSLQLRGSGLVLLNGRPEQALGPLAQRLVASRVHAAADVSPFAQARDRRVQRELAARGIELVLHPGVFVLEDLFAPRTGAGRPYTVFTPFYRRWCSEPRRTTSPAPAVLPALPDGWRAGGGQDFASALPAASAHDQLHGGEHAARQRLTRYLTGGVEDYAQRHDDLGRSGTSGLSADLHFGTLSPRELEYRLPDGDGGQALRRQLAWRDFYAHVLGTHPDNARAEHQPRYRRTLAWDNDRELFAAWCEGRTGYPLVDAGMRELNATGLMHNRARMVVGSFLVKDLAIDWRWGERWFMRQLLDGDEANNNGNWQWIASVGVDPSPPARRIFNPTLQQRRFDPDGRYVRRWVPELARLLDAQLAEPWTLDAAAQRVAGCVIGVDYPAPIVDHAQARREALARYAQARGREL